jgi:hypothetical protein
MRRSAIDALDGTKRTQLGKKLAGVFWAALVIRLIFCFVAVPGLDIGNGPQTEEFYSSTDGYVDLAQNLVEHHTFAFAPDAPPTTFRAPAFPFALAMVYALAGNMGVAVLIVNCLSSAVAAVLAAMIAFELIPQPSSAALFAAALLPFSIWYCASGYSDTFLTATVLMYAFCLVRWIRAPKTGRAVAVGAAHAVTVLTKAVLLPFPLLLLVYVAVRKRALCRGVLVSGLVAAALIGGWTYRNYRVSGRFIAVSQGMGFNLLAGTYMIDNGTDARASFKYGVERTLAQLSDLDGRTYTHSDLRPTGHFDVDPDFDRRCGRLAVSQFWHEPPVLLRKVFWNSIRFWYFTVTPERGSLAALLNFPLVALGLLGLLRVRRGERGAFEALILLGVFFVLMYSIIIVSGPRFCVPLLMLLSPFAGQIVADAWFAADRASNQSRYDEEAGAFDGAGGALLPGHGTRFARISKLRKINRQGSAKPNGEATVHSVNS